MTSPGLTPDTIRSDIADVLEAPLEEVEEGTNLLDLGLDSVRIMMLAQRWSDATGQVVEFASLAEEPELGAWSRYLAELEA